MLNNLAYEAEADMYPDALALRKALFKDGNCYGGCGGCNSLVVREVPLGQPVFAFNLD